MARSLFISDFAKRLRSLRMQRGISQDQLAYDARIHRTAISLIERGLRAVRLETVERLAQALHVQPRDMMPELELREQRRVRVLPHVYMQPRPRRTPGSKHRP